jgi:hypothetical protein
MRRLRSRAGGGLTEHPGVGLGPAEVAPHEQRVDVVQFAMQRPHDRPVVLVHVGQTEQSTALGQGCDEIGHARHRSGVRPQQRGPELSEASVVSQLVHDAHLDLRQSYLIRDDIWMRRDPDQPAQRL